MPLDSWTSPDDTPALAATATAMIDAALVGSTLGRDAYWAAVRKGYNTPYNDPAPRKRPGPIDAVGEGAITVAEPAPALPIAAMAALAAENRAI